MDDNTKTPKPGGFRSALPPVHNLGAGESADAPADVRTPDPAPAEAPAEGTVTQ